MSSIIPGVSSLKLSICITTFNRSPFIGATLESILNQLTSDCEVVVLDGGSTDNTEQVVSEYAQRFDRLRYVRQETNNGGDRDCNRVVELAAGEYCWIASDDDLLKPSAVAAVLEALRQDLSLVILNVEFRDFKMSKIVQRRWLNLESDRIYARGEMDRLFAELGYRLLYLGGVVVKRAIWLARERTPYYGSYFIHVGMIFQAPLPGEALVMAEPFISFRTSNTHSWSSHVIDIIWVRWPSLVWSLPLSQEAKAQVCGVQPWRSLGELLVWRAFGFYSLAEYLRHIRPRLRLIHDALTPALVALLPGALVNALLVLYYSVANRPSRRLYQGWRQPDLMLVDLRNSRYYFRNWRVFKRNRSAVPIA